MKNYFFFSFFAQTLEEEHIVDESEVCEEHLMSDSQLSGNGADSTDASSRANKEFLVRQKRQNLTDIHDLDIKDSDAYIETTETDPDDPLSLEQICVPVDGVNVFYGLSS